MKRSLAAASLVPVLVAASPIARAASFDPALDFDRTFDARGEAATLHFTADYRLRDGLHRIEVWRDGDRRIRRRTDDAIETYLDKPTGSDEWTMTLLDLRRRIRTTVTRTNLLRIGHVADWFAEGHGLTRPVGPYALTRMPAAPAPVPLGPCVWYRLEAGGHARELCWSTAERLPLAIVDEAGVVVWRVTAVSSAPFASDAFRIDDAGFARNDADADIADD